MEQVDNLPSGKHVIKSHTCGKFIGLAYENSNVADLLFVGFNPYISKNSVVTFEKYIEGFLIKNCGKNKYLSSPYDSSSDVMGSYWKNNITSDCYFDIFKKNGMYIIKSKKFSDYLTTNVRGNETSLWLKRSIDNTSISNSYFIFQEVNFPF